jgi:hypothetical protein
MSESLPRRRLLTGGAALAATAVLAAPALSAPTAQAAQPGTIVVRWNAALRKWAPRPAHADFGVVFLSTNDPHATPPSDPRVQAGDVWRRHPDAVAA